LLKVWARIKANWQ